MDAQKIAEFKAKFDALDKMGSGEISAVDVQRIFQEMDFSDEEARNKTSKILSSAAKRRDNKISWMELQDALEN